MAQERLAERYDGNAPGYDAAVGHNLMAARRLVASLPVQPYRSLLDLGCGTGFAAMAMVDRFPELREVVGLDVSAGMLDELARKLVGRDVESRLVEADVSDLARLDLAVDVALCSMAFHWFTDRPAALAAVASSLSPRGVFALVSPGVGHDQEFVEVLRGLRPPVPAELPDAFPRSSIDPEVLAADLRAAGLEPIDVWEERRVRRTPVEPYLSRMQTVGSHTMHAIMQPAEVAAAVERIAEATAAASGPRGFEYTFVKTYAVARREGG